LPKMRIIRKDDSRGLIRSLRRNPSPSVAFYLERIPALIFKKQIRLEIPSETEKSGDRKECTGTEERARGKLTQWHCGRPRFCNL
jgi:hypothetical protein